MKNFKTFLQENDFKLQPEPNPDENIDIIELQRSLSEAIYDVLKSKTNIYPSDCSVFAKKYGEQIGISIKQFLSN